MGRYSWGGWAPYVPVAERRRKAARKLASLAKQGHACAPITLEGRTIARTFWAKAWCNNLESYSDYANRLPRGRTYVRNGSVVDLQIQTGKVTALVAGSDTYRVDITVRPLEPAPWKAILKECAGRIGSLIELLQGRLSHAVMEVVTRAGTGLFPTPKQITFGCSCPDGAYMCKHVAAVLYGVGARLDHQPELLFLLRHADPQELIREAGSAPVAQPQSVLDKDQRLDTPDLGGLFGIDLEDAPAAAPSTASALRPEAPSKTTRRNSALPQSAGQRPPPLAAPAARQRSRVKTITARELTARGIPHPTLQNWLNAGVLLRTDARGVYKTTAETEARIEQYLHRSRASHVKK